MRALLTLACIWSWGVANAAAPSLQNDQVAVSDLAMRGPGGLALDSIGRLQDAWRALSATKDIAILLKDNDQSLVLQERVSDGGWETTKFQAYYRGLEVIGSLAMHHRGPTGTDLTDALVRFDLSTEPRLSPEDAALIARHLTGSPDSDLKLLESPALKILPSETLSDSALLVYTVTLPGNDSEPGRDVIIDAHTGTVVADVSHWITIAPAPIQVLSANRRCMTLRQDGAPIDYDPGACPVVVRNGMALSGADSSAMNALDNSKAVLGYFSAAHGRNSYDGKGSALVSIVHMGEKYDNAFWDSQKNIMAYGDGNGRELGDMTLATDVAGHEMTHGVVSQTARLQYFGESGALNEALADVFGELIANDGDWVIGRKLFIDPSAQGIRNLAQPRALTFKYKDPVTGQVSRRPYPASMAEKLPSPTTCDATNDRCWVHINSTIFGHGAYRVIQAIGRDRAQKILYRAMTQLIGPRTGLAAGAQAVIRACGQIYGSSSSTCTATQNALAEVGLSQATRLL